MSFRATPSPMSWRPGNGSTCSGIGNRRLSSSQASSTIFCEPQNPKRARRMWCCRCRRGAGSGPSARTMPRSSPPSPCFVLLIAGGALFLLEAVGWWPRAPAAAAGNGASGGAGFAVTAARAASRGFARSGHAPKAAGASARCTRPHRDGPAIPAPGRNGRIATTRRGGAACCGAGCRPGARAGSGRAAGSRRSRVAGGEQRWHPAPASVSISKVLPPAIMPRKRNCA